MQRIHSCVSENAEDIDKYIEILKGFSIILSTSVSVKEI